MRGRCAQQAVGRGYRDFAAQSGHAHVHGHQSGIHGSDGTVVVKPEREHAVALTCATSGGAVAQTTQGDLPNSTCRLGHSFAADELGEAPSNETRRVLETALRMFEERVELARRLAEVQQRRGRPVSAAHWEATSREMDEAAGVLRRLLTPGRTRPNPGCHDGAEPDPA